MAVHSLDHYIASSPDVAGGRPRIAGRRITVEDIAIWHERLGRSIEEICIGHNLGLAEVHAALAYYFDHKAEIDKRIRDDEAWLSSLKASTPSALERRLKDIRGA